MEIKQHIVTLILPSSSGSLLTDHHSGAFLKQIARSALLAGVLGVAVVLATSCSSTATGFNPLLISSVPNNQRGVPHLILISLAAEYFGKHPNKDAVIAKGEV